MSSSLVLALVQRRESLFGNQRENFKLALGLLAHFFNELWINYVIRGWKCHFFCHNWRHVFWKKITHDIVIGSTQSFCMNHKTYNLLLCETCLKQKQELKNLMKSCYVETNCRWEVRFVIAWKFFVLVVFRLDLITLFSSTLEMLTVATCH